MRNGSSRVSAPRRIAALYDDARQDRRRQIYSFGLYLSEHAKYIPSMPLLKPPHFVILRSEALSVRDVTFGQRCTWESFRDTSVIMEILYMCFANRDV